jgi:hypothetical protein
MVRKKLNHEWTRIHTNKKRRSTSERDFFKPWESFSHRSSQICTDKRRSHLPPPDMVGRFVNSTYDVARRQERFSI